MKYEAVIFDLDGTLLNTLEDLCDSTNFALSQFGYPPKSIDDVRSFVGNGIGKLIERALPGGTENNNYGAVLETFKEHYAENCNNKTKAYEGIHDLLEALKTRGVKTAVVSNKVDSAVKELCERYFPGNFQFTLGEKEGIKRKPAPDSVLQSIAFLQTKKEAAVYIGDSEVDVETAKNANIDLIAVSWGFRDKQLLASMGNFTIVDTPKELSELIFD